MFIRKKAITCTSNLLNIFILTHMMPQMMNHFLLLWFLYPSPYWAHLPDYHQHSLLDLMKQPGGCKLLSFLLALPVNSKEMKRFQTPCIQKPGNLFSIKLHSINNTLKRKHLSPPLLLNAKWLISTQSVTADSNIEIKVRIANLRCSWLSNRFSLSMSWEINWGHMENMLIEVRKLSGRLNESYARITYTSH